MSRVYLKIIVFSLVCILAAILGLALALPSILSTPWGQERLVGWINRSIPGTISIQRLQLSWFGKQELEGFELKDTLGKRVLSLNSLTSDALPYQLFSRIPALGTTTLVGLEVNLVQDQGGLTNLQKSLEIAPKEKQASGHNSSTSHALSWEMPLMGTFSLANARLSWAGVGMDPLLLMNVSATLSCPSKKGPLQISITGLSRQRDLNGEFSVHGIAEGFNSAGALTFSTNEAGWPLPEKDGRLAITVSVNHLPVDVIDRFLTLHHPSLAGAITEAIGPSLDLNLKQTLSRQGMVIALNTTSKNLRAEIVTAGNGGIVSLQKPGQISWTMTPQFARFLTPSALFQLSSDTKVEAILERFEFSPDQLALNGFFNPIRLRWSVADMNLIGAHSIGSLQITDCRGVVERLAADQALLANSRFIIGYDGLSSEAQLDGILTDITSGTWDMGLKVNSLPVLLIDRLSSAEGHVVETIGSTAGIGLNVKHTPENTLADLQIESEQFSLPSLQLEIGSTVSLRAPTQVQMAITPNLVSRLLPSGWMLKQPASISISLDRLQLPFPWLPAHKLIAYEADIAFPNIQFIGKPEITHLQLHVKGSLEKINYRLKGNLSLDQLSPVLVTALGRSSDFDLTGEMKLQEWTIRQHSMQTAVHNARFDLKASVAIIDHAKIELLNPATLRYTADPQALQTLALIANRAPQLNFPTVLEAQVDTFSANIAPFQWNDLSLSSHGTIAKLDLFFNTTVRAGEGKATISFSSNGLTGNVAVSLPDKKEAADAFITAQIQGRQGGQLKLDGQIAQKELTLRQPMIVEIPLTPALIQTLFQGVPILSKIAGKNQTTKLTIDPNGFSIPLFEPKLTTMRIGKATLDIDRVQFLDSWQMTSLVALLEGSKEPSQRQLSVQFTPIFFSLINGVFRIQRLDALINDKYPIASWGKIDLPKDKVNMTIGITARALKKAYALPNLDPHYMLQLSLHGKTRDVSLDKVKAASRIAALVAQSTGGAGLLLGGVLDLIGIGFNESQIPLPTSKVPWDTETEVIRNAKNAPPPNPTRIPAN